MVSQIARRGKGVGPGTLGLMFLHISAQDQDS